MNQIVTGVSLGWPRSPHQKSAGLNRILNQEHQTILNAVPLDRRVQADELSRATLLLIQSWQNDTIDRVREDQRRQKGFNSTVTVADGFILA